MFQLVRSGVSAAVLVVCSLGAVSAQPLPSPSPSPSPGLPSIGRVVTSDRRSEPIANTTRPTFVVDRSAIESFGSRSITDALANVPGFDAFAYGPFGAQANYGIRGTTSANTLILRDGIPVIAASNGITDLGSLSTIGVQRVEVVESGASTLYGTSATGGVINLISETSPRPYLRLADGTYGNRDLAAGWGAGGLSASFERHVARNVYDYPALAYAGGNAVPAGTRTNADAEQTALRLSYLGRLAHGWTTRLSAGDDAIRVGVPGSVVYGTTPDARQNTTRQDVQLDLGHLVGTSSFDFSLAANRQQLTYADPGPSLGGETDTYDGRVQASLRYSTQGARTDLVSGIDLSRESALLTFGPPFGSAPPTPPLGAFQSQAAVYAQLGYAPLASTRLTFGLRGENDAPHGAVLAPSFGLGVRFGAARVSANLGESFRVPTLIDLYYPGFSNPDLKAERFANYDATLALDWHGGNVSLGTFGRNGSNLITLDPTTFLPFNAKRVSVNGLQFSAATAPYHHLRATAGITNLYRALDTTTGLRLPFTVPVTATVGLERPFDDGSLAFGARARVVGSSADIPVFTPHSAGLADPYSGYTIADAYVRYRLAPYGIATLRVRNLGGERYAPIFGYPAAGRTVELELSTR